ncbi:MAG: acyltransferase [Pelomonas sp.]|nr:acyltransferase [Roseateles sp.]
MPVTLRSLQACRAIAALMVLFFHLGPTVQHYFGTAPLYVPFGHAGVDFFFVLSGFIIMSAHRADVGRPERLQRFLWKRFVRIYPVYWLVFLVAFAGAFRILDLTPSAVAKALLLVPTGIAPVISVAWSLQWEVVFYLLFATLIVHPLLAVAAVLAVLATRLPGGPMYLSLFAAGVGAALVVERWPRLPGRVFAAVGASVFAAACVVDALTGAKPTAWLGAGAAVMVAGLVRAERAGQVIGGQRGLQLLGNASYSLYLVHYPLISVGCKLATALGLHGESGAWIAYPVLLVAAVLAGVGLHLAVEQPLIHRLNRRWAPVTPAR